MVRVISSACSRRAKTRWWYSPKCHCSLITAEAIISWLTPRRRETYKTPSAKRVLYFISVQTNKEAGDTYTLFTVKHVAEVFVGFGVFADKSEYPFIRLVICTEGYPVQLTVVLHILGKKTKKNTHTNTRHSLFTHFMNVDTKSLLFSTRCLLSAELQVTGVGVAAPAER